MTWFANAGVEEIECFVSFDFEQSILFNRYTESHMNFSYH